MLLVNQFEVPVLARGEVVVILPPTLQLSLVKGLMSALPGGKRNLLISAPLGSSSLPSLKSSQRRGRLGVELCRTGSPGTWPPRSRPLVWGEGPRSASNPDIEDVDKVRCPGTRIAAGLDQRFARQYVTDGGCRFAPVSSSSSAENSSRKGVVAGVLPNL